MAYVAEHENVYSTCIELLKIKGWEIEIEPAPYRQDSLAAFYTAVKDGTTIRAGTPIGLLGLASIHEYHHPHSDKPYWWKIKNDKFDLLDRLEDEALERSFLKYIEEYPDEWKEVVRNAIEESKSDPGFSAYERIGISQKTFMKLLIDNPDIKNV